MLKEIDRQLITQDFDDSRLRGMGLYTALKVALNKAFDLGIKEEKDKKTTKQLIQIADTSQLNLFGLDDDYQGFECKGKLCEYEGYEDFYERLWVWARTTNDNVETLVTVDEGNGYFSIVYHDVLVRELLEA